MFRYGCPACKALLQSPENRAGMTVHCPACKHPIHVPKPPPPAFPHPQPHRHAPPQPHHAAAAHAPAHHARHPLWLQVVVLIAVVYGALAVAGVLVAWQCGLFGGEEADAPKVAAHVPAKAAGTHPAKKPSAREPLSVPLPGTKLWPKYKPSSEPAPNGPTAEEKQSVEAFQSAKAGTAAAASRIDELVYARLKEKGLTPAAPCSDGVFVRRAYLDVIGTLPTAAEARAFLKDSSADRRRVLIDQLLERPEFADFAAMRWGDVLRVKSEFPINLWPNAVRAYHHWIRTSLRENRPYDQFARTLLTSSGSNFRAPPVNFYRAVQKKDAPTCARAVALTFMGVRPQAWPEERWSGLAVYFSQVGYKATREWKEEIVFFDPQKPLKAEEAALPDGTRPTLVPGEDPRRVFADWLIKAENPWFTRNVANRVWYWLVGRGIIHEPDDVRPDNPPTNPELLAYLEQELIAAHYDLKHLYRLILNSRTYQQSCIPATEHPEAAALFASYPVRRLDAEVIIDAICQVTGTSEKYYSPIPEPFTYLPPGHRAVCLPDASITSAFLELFGRSPRDTGLESERNNTFTAAQKLHLLNSSHIQKKIEQGPGLAGIYNSAEPPEKVAEALYLTILSRYPTAEELAAVTSFAGGGARRRIDVAWALINSAEFLCRH